MDGSGSPSGQKEGFGFGNLCSSLQRRALHCSILLSAIILKIIYLEEYKNTQRIITLAGALQSSISFLQSCSCNAIAFDKERIRRRGKEENGIKEEDEELEEGEEEEMKKKLANRVFSTNFHCSTFPIFQEREFYIQQPNQFHHI